MFGNTINQNEVNVLFGSSDLDLYMGKIGIMAFAFIGKGCFDLSFALVPKLCCGDPSPVKIKFAFSSKPDDIVLLQFIQFEEY